MDVPTALVPTVCKVYAGVEVPIPMLPDLEINNKFVDHEVMLKDPVPNPTEADTDPVAM